MRNRFYVAEGLVAGATVELSGEEFHHAVRVHRSAVHDEVELFDGKGIAFLGRIESITNASAVIRVLTAAPSRESPLRITLASSLIQPDRFEIVLQKGTELGVARFLPVITERIELRLERAAGKLDRWRRIILEAAKQSGRSFLPILDSPQELQAVLREETERLFFDADAEPSPWPESLGAVILLIGPEGGWSPGEIDQARDAGCRFQTLGPRRLRAETAAVTAVSLVGTRFGDLS